MPEQFNGWLAQGGGVLTGAAALLHGGFVGGTALVVFVLAIAVKMAGPELREWVTMLWARKDANKAAETAVPTVADDILDAA